MAYHYGQDVWALVQNQYGDVVTSPDAQYLVYPSEDAETPLTDLLDAAGNPVEEGIITPDEHGWLVFSDPNEVSLGVWLSLISNPNPRVYLASRSISDIVVALADAVENNMNQGTIIPVGDTPPATPSLNDFWFDTNEEDEPTGEGTVTSVNGVEPEDGDVTLTPADLGTSVVYTITDNSAVPNGSPPGLIVRIT